MNNLLPPYFNSMKPKLPELCNVYSIRKSTFHLPVIMQEFAKQLIEYKLFGLLNTERKKIDLNPSKTQTL